MVLSKEISVKQRINLYKTNIYIFLSQSKFQELFYNSAVRNHPSKIFKTKFKIAENVKVVFTIFFFHEKLRTGFPIILSQAVYIKGLDKKFNQVLPKVIRKGSQFFAQNNVLNLSGF